MAKLFTIREDVLVGVEVILGSDMKIGDIPVGKSAVLDLEKRVSHMVAMLKKTDPTVTVEGTRCMLEAADLAEKDGEQRFIKEKSKWDREALVLVETPPGERGQMRLLSGKKVDKLTPDGRRVKWELAPVEEAVGVKVVAEFVREEGEKEVPCGFLIHMLPGARFTIARSGDLQGAAPELTVRWEGRWREKDVEARRSTGEHLNPKLWGLYLQKCRYRHADL